MTCLDSLQTRRQLRVGGGSHDYFALDAAYQGLGLNGTKLPFVLKILLENLLRNEDGVHVTLGDLKRLANRINTGTECEVSFMPTRVIMQDFTGVPALVDLAAMRDYVQEKGCDPSLINPKIPVDLVIDHSVQVDFYGTQDALAKNVRLEMSRNLERYKFLKWGQSAFSNLRVIPPGTGICHQVNLEHLAKIVWNCGGVLCPDTVVGTDSHTTMVNGIAVLGWGVGGIEAEAVMIGQPIVMTVPEVLGVELRGKLREGVTATDTVLTITNILRKKSVVGKFVEFYGEGLKNLSVFDRATIANMAPEYGATCGFFPFDQGTLDYLDITGRSKEDIDVVETYLRAQGLWYKNGSGAAYSDELTVDLAEVQPVVAGPKMPQERVLLSQVPRTLAGCATHRKTEHNSVVKNGDVVIAAITSCTNTSNPHVMIAAGLVARKAKQLGIRPKSWVKTSLTPGSRVVEAYLQASGLQECLDDIGFNIAGYGCATCIGNSGPLAGEIESLIKAQDLLVASVLSGNRNFEGRIHPCVKANFLASPPLVVIYALAGTVLLDLTRDPVCQDSRGNDVFLRDLWPSSREIGEVIAKFVSREVFAEKYKDVFSGDDIWKNVEYNGDATYNWEPGSTYVQSPPYFMGEPSSRVAGRKFNISGARILMLLGSGVTTDHISPAGNIPVESPAGEFLMRNGVQERDFNSYGARRGNHHVMLRGTFANIRIKNEMLNEVRGGFTKHVPTERVMTVFEAAMLYREANVPLVIIARQGYGAGSSRDWAAKGTLLLGVRAVIAEDFERIHRSNLVGMGVLPLTFKRTSDNVFSGNEVITLSGSVGVGEEIVCKIREVDGSEREIPLLCAINTEVEEEYLASGGVLHYVLKRMVGESIAGDA
ncbi:aconitate hydratase 1 [Anaplasma ovis str. Haibei]|uniref:Aconitate hydratase n=1 Tax=Anaplasma ovis str. Haibei TaxID=1248439 RepID=A0A2Z2LF80_9RICK|nr:aconitate hydratase AcnA [Anaplasma ovis]ASI47912.1 aconitate hydratase 1 [Anaplasma ovis str. Haibei]